MGGRGRIGSALPRPVEEKTQLLNKFGEAATWMCVIFPTARYKSCTGRPLSPPITGSHAPFDHFKVETLSVSDITKSETKHV